MQYRHVWTAARSDRFLPTLQQQRAGREQAESRQNSGAHQHTEMERWRGGERHITLTPSLIRVNPSASISGSAAAAGVSGLSDFTVAAAGCSAVFSVVVVLTSAAAEAIGTDKPVSAGGAGVGVGVAAGAESVVRAAGCFDFLDLPGILHSLNAQTKRQRRTQHVNTASNSRHRFDAPARSNNWSWDIVI